ncbi:hypothetical protein XOC_1748 [Xanthomonas oryzae pv. oryzicola BLS256]|uniref:Uncharacterized protein n=1 Tax=Xanthomonas oryzae pv. oryzicola (strain BLS256) TaxID=383407 RepID=G7TLU3_XANOB|nr:hypothetical protein XOC_1748 [Xanthomonas oryzae pv. oryzicola BLS256]QEO98164.1 hypothetical protein XOCgx_3175 [Xanthomonas oryzae pv. oryzicola]
MAPADFEDWPRPRGGERSRSRLSLQRPSLAAQRQAPLTGR